MFRLITAVVMVMMPIISVSTGTTEREFPFGARDLADEEGCYQGQTSNGCGGGGMDPFAGMDDRFES
jgi:hypothetical protein